MMDTSVDGSQERPRKDHVLWISNLALLVFTLAFVWAAVSLYRDRIMAISVSQSSFLTTEWRLLEQLKAQTDQQLFQKDKEIADLYRLYMELIQKNAPPSELQHVSDQLNEAKDERKAILSRGIFTTADTGSAQGESLKEQLSLSNEPALTGLLQKQIVDLQSQLDRSRALIDALGKERMALVSTQQQVVQRYDDAARENMARISELAATVSRKDAEVRAALAELQQLARETGPAQPLGIGDLKTQALVRALVGSPEIRAAYPDLLKSLDRFFELYALQQRLGGQQEAYASAESIREPLAGQAGAP